MNNEQNKKTSMKMMAAPFFNSSLYIILLLTAVCLSGCADLKPWVKPYERQKLADPIMSDSRHPIADSHVSHVYEARESAKGAEGSDGGGCGCN